MAIQKLLPDQYYDYLPLFEGDMTAELPSHRPGINHIFKLEKSENSQGRNPLLGSLYGMIYNKLLVLRKTLNELLDKGFIRASSSPEGAPVLFAKKERGFPFCVDC